MCQSDSFILALLLREKHGLRLWISSHFLGCAVLSTLYMTNNDGLGMQGKEHL